jgi:hypothetical protein
MLAQPVRARPGPRSDQTVEIVVDHGYQPQSIVARAGVPLRVVFRRRDADACTDRVVFSSPHLDRPLARGRATTIVLPPQAPGEVRFTCGMGRYHGQIQLRADRSSPFAELRAAVGRRLRAIWESVWRSPERTVAEEAMAILRARFARGEISQEEFERARALALADSREFEP